MLWTIRIAKNCSYCYHVAIAAVHIWGKKSKRMDTGSKFRRHGKTTCFCGERIHAAKAQLELKMANTGRDNKKSFLLLLLFLNTLTTKGNPERTLV